MRLPQGATIESDISTLFVVPINHRLLPSTNGNCFKSEAKIIANELIPATLLLSKSHRAPAHSGLKSMTRGPVNGVIRSKSKTPKLTSEQIRIQIQIHANTTTPPLIWLIFFSQQHYYDLQTHGLQVKRAHNKTGPKLVLFTRWQR